MTERVETRLRVSAGAAVRAIEATLLGNRSATESQARARLSAQIAAPSRSDVWFALAVINGSLPAPDEVVWWHRHCALNGFSALLTRRVRRRRLGRVIVTGAVLVDAHHTLVSGLGTGIQRVARKVLESWAGARAFLAVGWDAHFERLVELEIDGSALVRAGRDVLIPWDSRYVLLELATERSRLDRMQALAQHSPNRASAIGLDCVPMTMSETTGPGMPGAFARNLATLAHFERIAGISDAATAEYAGWRRMISSAGLEGPEVRTVALAQEAVGLDVPAVKGETPLVLCVGSAEPRKNQGAVLHAAELLWREGLDFRLVFVGGNAWRSERFVQELDRLQGMGRPVAKASGVDDAALNRLYREATVTIFPSLHEGYGLPIVESLAVGTPVITSRYGSMRELGEGGALFVDPRDDHDVTRALGLILRDSSVRDRLSAAGRSRPTRNWTEYSDELWSFLVGVGREPSC